MPLTQAEKDDGMIEVEVWVAVDAEERVWAHEDLDTLKERLAEDDASITRRVVRVTIKLPVPTEIEVAVELPAESSEAVVTVK